MTVSFEEKEYFAEEGSAVTICIEYEESVQRSFEVSLSLLSVMGVYDGINLSVCLSPPSLSFSFKLSFLLPLSLCLYLSLSLHVCCMYTLL